MRHCVLLLLLILAKKKEKERNSGQTNLAICSKIDAVNIVDVNMSSAFRWLETKRARKVVLYFTTSIEFDLNKFVWIRKAITKHT